jgi:hypothetical protein
LPCNSKAKFDTHINNASFAKLEEDRKLRLLAICCRIMFSKLQKKLEIPNNKQINGTREN